nr:MAG TPA: hypothetical protein [Caudoviricetes sp.]
MRIKIKVTLKDGEANFLVHPAFEIEEVKR